MESVIETDNLAHADQIRVGNAVAGGQGLPVPTKAKSDGVEGIATANPILPCGNRPTLRMSAMAVAIDHLHPAGWRAGTTAQQGAQQDACQ